MRAEAAAPSWAFDADGQRSDALRAQAEAQAASAALLSRSEPTTAPSTSADFARWVKIRVVEAN